MKPFEDGNYTEEEIYRMVRQNQKAFGQWGLGIMLKKILGYALFSILPITLITGFIMFPHLLVVPAIFIIAGLGIYLIRSVS